MALILVASQGLDYAWRLCVTQEMGQLPGRRGIATLIAASAALTGCSGGSAESRTVQIEESRRGLTLEATVTGTGKFLVVETVVRNDRRRPVYLVPDQCGRVTEALLAQTVFEPEGRTWQGSLQAVKELILESQRFRQNPSRFAPRIPGDTSSSPPKCVSLRRPFKLVAGAKVAERWELPVGAFYETVGSAHSLVRVEVVEARAPDELEYLDILSAGEADEERAGRNVRVETPASSVTHWDALDVTPGPTLAELYDELVRSRPLRQWIEAQPADSWQSADLSPSSGFTNTPDTEQARLTLVTTEYERAATALAREDGSDVSVDLPTARDRTRVFARRPGTLPPAVELIDEPDGYVLREDILPGSLTLPSGRVVVGEYLFDEKPLPFRVRPGSYPVHCTLARYRGKTFDDVALATLVLSDEPTVRWHQAGSFAVDGGSTTFTSPEGVAFMNDVFDKDEDELTRLDERIFTSRSAHDYHVTEFALDRDLNLVEFSSGGGDGGYPVYIGRDAAGEPTRVVVDFFLLHLDWP